MTGNIFDRLFNKTEEDKKSCDNCLYYRRGRCCTQFESDCKDNNFFVWYPKDEDK